MQAGHTTLHQNPPTPAQTPPNQVLTTFVNNLKRTGGVDDASLAELNKLICPETKFNSCDISALTYVNVNVSIFIEGLAERIDEIIIRIKAFSTVNTPTHYQEFTRRELEVAPPRELEVAPPKQYNKQFVGKSRPAVEAVKPAPQRIALNNTSFGAYVRQRDRYHQDFSGEKEKPAPQESIDSGYDDFVKVRVAYHRGFEDAIRKTEEDLPPQNGKKRVAGTISNINSP